MAAWIRWVPALVLGISLSNGVAVRADAVVLKTGGELRGELQAGPENDRVAVRTLSGAQVVVSKSFVESVNKRRLVLEEYETLRRSVPDTVEDQWKLAEWCREKSLRPERERHLKRIIDLEPDHADAHRHLGHVLHDGEWTTRDEIMRGRGYVKYKGRWMLPQELELVVREEQENEAEKGWYKRINLWHDWLDGNRPERQTEGFKNLTAITDANAIPALFKAFSNDTNEDQRLMYVSIVSQIRGVKAVGPLVFQSLKDDSDAVRMKAIKGLPEDQYGEAVPVYVRGLKNELNIIVNRAAVALGIIGDEAVVPGLIDALVTRHVYKTYVPDQTFGVGVTPNGQMTQSVPTAVLPPDIAVMALTGQLPYGVQVNQAPAVEPRKKKVLIRKDESNPMVHAALRKLTGQDYGYNESAWKAWWNTARGGKRLKP